MDFRALSTRLERVREEISEIQLREGLDHRVTVVGVTKGHEATAVRAAAEAGLLDVGESRVQEALEKQALVSDSRIRWHLVGHLQTNKARQVPGRFALVHSVDSLRVAEALERGWEKLRGQPGAPSPPPPVRVLVQVNVAGESQKSGCDPEEAGELIGRIGEFPGLGVEGLMTMAPLADDDAAQRRVFGKLHDLRDRLIGRGARLPELSMGMSDDFRAAVAEGATMVRLGTILFGVRPG